MNDAITPFTPAVPQADLEDLDRTIDQTRWPDAETVDDWTQGAPLAKVKALVDHWRHRYDWRRCEATLNGWGQYKTTVGGLDLHFLDVRSQPEKALPLIITHGWPGSVIEQLKIIDPLTNPTAHGGKVEDAFDLVIPSMPGYGYSGKPVAPGWDPDHIARAWVVLMKRLGYTKFVAQGGDWGALITQLMGVQAQPELLAIHTNMRGAFPPDTDKAAFVGAPAPAGLSDEEKHAYDHLVFFYTHGLSYAQEMGHKPQTLYAIADSH